MTLPNCPTFQPPTVQNFKDYFIRDFSYGPGLEFVTDKDIQKALNITASVFNPRLFSTAPVGTPPNITSEAQICYLNASAHFLVTSIQATGGLGQQGKGASSQGEGNVSSKSVGGVSVSYTWPEKIVNNPALYQFSKTSYGSEYLQILILKLVGNVSAAWGETVRTPNVPFIF